MQYRYFVDFRHGVSVFANFSYGFAVLGTPQCPPLHSAMGSYYKLRQLFFFLLHGLILIATVITKCDDYYKLLQYRPALDDVEYGIQYVRRAQTKLTQC